MSQPSSFTQKPPTPGPPPLPPPNKIAMDALLDAALAASNYARNAFSNRGNGTGSTLGLPEAIQAMDAALQVLNFVVTAPGATPDQKAAILARLYGNGAPPASVSPAK